MGSKTQDELPGMESRDLPEIEQAAEQYRQIRNERCLLSKQEAEAKASLIQVMKNKGRSFYAYNGLKIEVSAIDNVKVKSARDEDDDEPIGEFVEKPAPPLPPDPPPLPQTQIALSQMTGEEAVEKFLGKKKKEKLSHPCRWAEGCTEDAGPHHQYCEAHRGEADNFTAERCEECKMIDGGHKPECSKSGALTYVEYLEFATATGVKMPKAVARKMALTRECDEEVRTWIESKKKNVIPMKSKAAGSGKGKKVAGAGRGK